MYTESDVKLLVDNESHVLYAKNFRGHLQYYSLPPEALISLLTKAYNEGFGAGFAQADKSQDSFL